MDAFLSGAGLVFGLVFFLASFGPSLLPRRWLAQGVAGGMSAAVGYLLGFVLDRTLVALLDWTGFRVQVTRVPTGTDWVLAIAGGLLLCALWWWSAGKHRETAALVGMPRQPLWHDLAATLVALITLALLMALVAGLVWLSEMLASQLGFLPPLLAAIVAIGLVALMLRMVNRIAVRRAYEGLAASAVRLNRTPARSVTAPTSPLRSGSPAATQSWDDLGRRGQIFTACGPDADRIAAVTGAPALEPIRVYAALGAGGVEEAVAIALTEVRRTGALQRRVLSVITPAGRGWVDEFNVQAVEYLTGGDCATVALQYSYLASAVALVANPQGPREASRLLFEALEDAVADLPEEERPAIYVSGESLGAYGGHGPFADADDMLARTSGGVWIGTPGFTEISRKLIESRQKGSPEITPAIANGRHIRFITRPAELVADAYDRPLGQWLPPRIVYLQYASDPMARFNAALVWSEPDWMRERAGRDVNPSLRWWPVVSWFQICMDMLVSLDTPPGHGHIYEDDLVPVWAAVLNRPPKRVADIIEAIRTDVQRLRSSKPMLTANG